MGQGDEMTKQAEKIRYVITRAEYGSSGRLMMQIRRSAVGPWALCEEAPPSDPPPAAPPPADPPPAEPTIADLQAKLAQRDKTIADASKWVDAAKKAEDDKKAADDKKAEDARIKAGEAAKVIEEKDKANADLAARLKVYDDEKSATADKLFGELPDVAKEALAGLKDKLSPAEWSATVEKQHAFAVKVDPEKKTIITSGGDPVPAKDGTHELSAKAQEILKEENEGLIMIKDKLTVNRVKDEESGAVHSRFSRPTHEYYSDMKRSEVYRIDKGLKA